MPSNDIGGSVLVILSESEAQLVYALLGEATRTPRVQALLAKIERILVPEALQKFGWSE